MPVNYRKLIADSSRSWSVAHSLWQAGYYPVPVGSGSDAKGWIEDKDDLSNFGPYLGPDTSSGVPLEPPNMADTLERVFEAYSGCGVGVLMPYIRGRTDLILVGIDVDFDDQPTMDIIAFILGKACPVKRGQKGATFFCAASPDILSPKEEYVSRGLAPTRLVTKTKIKSPDGRAIDILGTATKSHSILPPTRHWVATQKLGSHVGYQWIPFPGTDITRTLEDTPPDQLPRLQSWSLFLLSQFLKNPSSSIFDFIARSSPGDFHAPMLSASTFMWHEGFTLSEIEDICTREAEFTCTSEAKLRERKTQIANALRGLKNVVPAPVSTKSTPKDKVPPDRMISEWFMSHMGEGNIVRVHNRVCVWDGSNWDTYCVGADHDPKSALYSYLANKFKEESHKTITAATAMTLQRLEVKVPTDGIPFRNGVYDLERGILRPEEREDYITEHLSVDYDPNSQCPMWDQFLSGLFEDAGMVSAVEEYLGLCLSKTHSFQSALAIYGPTGTGKSELMKVIKGLFCRDQISEVSMSNINDPNHRRYMLHSNINLCSEAGRSSIGSDSDFLRMTAGEAVAVKTLYKDVENEILSARLIISGNLPPMFSDTSGAVARRLILIPVTAKRPEKPIMDLNRQILSQASGIFNRLLVARARLFERGYFVTTKAMVEEREEVSSGLSSVAGWMNDRANMEFTGVDSDSRDNWTSVHELYADYVEWCDQNGFRRGTSTFLGVNLHAMGYRSKNKRLVSGRQTKVRNIVLYDNGLF